MSLKAEELPVEIWLNVLSYFEGHDLVRSFSCLNSFFNRLLHSSYLKLHMRIRVNESNRKLPDSPWSHINVENIYSLAVGRRKANCLLRFLRWHAPSLKNLSFLSVYIRKSSDYQNIELLLSALSKLPFLNHLRKVHLHILCNQFIELLAFKTLAPNLESLSIDGYLSNRDENYFHEHMWNQLFTNLKHVQVNLQHSPTSSSVKTTLRDYIAKLYDKPWFSHYENEDFLIVFIKFKLVN